MDSKERQKMCTHCDGRIAVSALTCPYCGAGQTKEGVDVRTAASHRSLQDSLTALYTPPYTPKKMQPQSGDNSFGLEEKPHTFKESLSEKKINTVTGSLGTPTLPASDMQGDSRSEVGEKGIFFPIVMLSLGANLLILGLLQLFFSDGGVLRLEWDSRSWFVYCLFALPIFCIGLKKVNALK